MSSLKIAFLHDWDMPVNEYLDNQDGLPAAIQIIAKKQILQWYTRGNNLTFLQNGATIQMVPTDAALVEKIRIQSPDVIVCWGGLDRPWWEVVHKEFARTPKVLLFAGGPRNHIARSYFRVIVCESQCYIDDFTKAGVTAVRGFGTNTQVFHPVRMPKVWDAIYPASLCFHKNIELFCQAMLGHGLCVGNHNEPNIASKVLSCGTNLLHRVNSTALADLYNMSRVTVVTAGPQGGAQRVVLESMACGVPVVVMNDHDRCMEFVQESGFGAICHPIAKDIMDTVNELIAKNLDPMIGWNYIQSKWTEDHYAESVLSACKKAMLN